MGAGSSVAVTIRRNRLVGWRADEIGRSIGDAANGAGNIATTISGVADAARATTSSLSEADHTVNEPGLLARDLQSSVTRFRV